MAIVNDVIDTSDTGTRVEKIVTRESLQAMLDSDDRQFVEQVIGRALVVLFNNQTESEKITDSTNEYNMEGFTGADGYGGSLTAKYFIKHRKLLDWQIEKWLKRGKSGFSRLAKYHRQLNDAAMQKAAA